MTGFPSWSNLTKACFPCASVIAIVTPIKGPSGRAGETGFPPDAVPAGQRIAVTIPDAP